MSVNSDVIIHFGVKGMKWGIRKEYEPNPRLSAKEREVVERLAEHGYTESRMRRMYGPPEDTPRKGLTDKQKLIIKTTVAVGAVAVVAGMAIYGGKKLGPIIEANRQKAEQIERLKRDIRIGVADYNAEKALRASPFYNRPNLSEFWAKHEETSLKHINPLSKEDVARMSTQGFEWKPGSIFKRVSSAKETTIREGGFYAAHRAEDVERYKAVLPIYWKRWGQNAKEGFVVSLENTATIKAPSPRKAFDIFRDSFDDDLPAQIFGMKLNKFSDHFPALPGEDKDATARRVYGMFAANWVDGDNQAVGHYFSKLKNMGYNALQDYNDAGSLSDSPMRFLDGKLFKIAGHEDLTADLISKAQDAITALKHALINLFRKKVNTDG